MRAIFLGLVLVACSKPAPPSVIADAAAPSASVVAPASADADAAHVDQEARARAVVTKWNDALDKHDLDALRALYADRIDFYGHSMTRDAVVTAKQKAFAAAPGFHQSIVGPIDLTHEKGVFTARFQKRSGGAKQSEVEARIVVDDGKVLVESDRTVNAPRKSASCEEVAGAVVFALPEVKRVIDEDFAELKSTKSDGNVGGIGPIPEEGGGFSAGIGIHTPERYEAQIWYEVDATAFSP